MAGDYYDGYIYAIAQSGGEYQCKNVLVKIDPDIGVGSCWVCYLDREKMAELLQIPEQYTLQCLLVMGMPGEKAAPSERHNKRFALDKTVWFEKFK